MAYFLSVFEYKERKSSIQPFFFWSITIIFASLILGNGFNLNPRPTTLVLQFYCQKIKIKRNKKEKE